MESDLALDTPRLWALRCMLSYWRCEAPARGPAQETEFDGLNEVEYDARGRIWRKLQEREADLEALPNRSAIPIRFEVDGRIDFSFGPNRTVLAGSGLKTTRSFLGARSVGESKLAVDWRHAPAAAQWKASYAHEYPFVEASRAAENERALQERTLAGASLEELVRKAEQPSITLRQRNDLFLRLRALFYLRPTEADRALGLTKPVTVDLLAESLAGAGNEASQAALGKLLEREIGTESFQAHLALLIPLVRMEKSCRDTLLRAAFESADVDLRYTAQLILGSNVRRCLRTNPAQAKAFGDRLVEALPGADADGKLNLLYALGNAGDPERLPIQESFLTDANPRLRAGAVHSLRLLLDARMRRRLEELAKVETDAGVRQEIEELLTGAGGSN